MIEYFDMRDFVWVSRVGKPISNGEEDAALALAFAANLRKRKRS